MKEFNEVTRVFAELGGEASSLHIAGVFGKRHDNVLKKIDNIPDNIRDELGIYKSYYVTSQNRKQKVYRLNRDAYTYLILSMTCDWTARFRLEYIRQFNINFRLDN